MPGTARPPTPDVPTILVARARGSRLPYQLGCAQAGQVPLGCTPCSLHKRRGSQGKVVYEAYRYIYEASNDLKPGRRKTTCKDTMDNHKVFCGLIIFLQIADLPRGSTYDFSLCNHDQIQEYLLNALDLKRTFTKEELQLDFHTCEDAPFPPAGPQQFEGSRRAGRLLECVLERARGCGRRPPRWRNTLSVLQRHCPGYRPPKGAAAGKASRGPCDESKARELMAVWRSYMNLG